MNKQQYTFLLILLALSIGLFAYYLFFHSNYQKNKVENNIPLNRITKENFVLEYTYKGSNKWEYSITGQLPNPCYKAATDVLVAESYPEQASVIVTVTPPDDDVMCAQVISEYSDSGEFSASEKANVSLQVK